MGPGVSMAGPPSTLQRALKDAWSRRCHGEGTDRLFLRRHRHLGHPTERRAPPGRPSRPSPDVADLLRRWDTSLQLDAAPQLAALSRGGGAGVERDGRSHSGRKGDKPSFDGSGGGSAGGPDEPSGPHFGAEEDPESRRRARPFPGSGCIKRDARSPFGPKRGQPGGGGCSRVAPVTMARHVERRRRSLTLRASRSSPCRDPRLEPPAPLTLWEADRLRGVGARLGSSRARVLSQSR